MSTSWQDPYGARRGTAPAGWVGERGFVGGTNDATGLVRIGARDYDTLLGRFVTVDPVQDLADPLQWNPYLYANNSPITKSDPSGLRPIGDGDGEFVPRWRNGRTEWDWNGHRSKGSGGHGSSGPVPRPSSSPLLPGNFWGGVGAMLGDTGAALVDALVAYANPNSAYAAQRLVRAATMTPESWWAGVTDPYTSRWNSGDQAGAVGYGVGEVVLTVLLMKGAGRVLKLGTVGGGATATGAAAGLSDEMAATFVGGRYTSSVLSQDTVLYRAGIAGKPFGQFYSAEKPVGVVQTRIDKAIPPFWADGTAAPLDTGYAIRIPKGTTVYSGEVANQGGIYVGGTGQVVVLQPWNVPGAEVVESWPLR